MHVLSADDAVPCNLQASMQFARSVGCGAADPSPAPPVAPLQARWRSELRERELDRMAQLEGEIRRREAARTAEVAALRSLLAAQQQQIVALQAQVHEQGGSAQGEAQGFECRVGAVVLLPC